jgi:H+/Cl- antiporter ClcA
MSLKELLGIVTCYCVAIPVAVWLWRNGEESAEGSLWHPAYGVPAMFWALAALSIVTVSPFAWCTDENYSRANVLRVWLVAPVWPFVFVAILAGLVALCVYSLMTGKRPWIDN